MSLFSELKDRKVFRVAAVYLVVAWVIMQVVAVVSAPLLLPDWFARVVILLLTLGFPIALILSWAFDATPAESGNSNTISGKPLAIGLIALTVIAIGFIITGFNSGESGAEEIAAVESPEPIAPAIELPEEQGVLPNSVAVLLCDNLSPNPDDAYFAAGIHEEILNQLVKLSALNVIARTSVMKYAGTDMGIPEIAAELNIGSVMECSVRFAGTSIMVTAQLIDPVTNSHLWSETYPGDIGDLSGVFAMQADIAMNIANSLHAAFSLEEQTAIEKVPTQAPEAYTGYLKGVVAFDDGFFADAVTFFEEAIAIDPQFGLALAFKAHTLESLMAFGIGDTEENRQLVVQLAEEALSIDPSLVNAHLAIAAIHKLNWQRQDAESAYARLYELYPGEADVMLEYAAFRRGTQDNLGSIELLQRGTRLNPNAMIVWHQLGVAYMHTGMYDEALQAFSNALALNPGFPPSLFDSGWAHIMKGEISTGERLFRQAEASGFMQLYGLTSWLSVGYLKMGLLEDTLRLLGEVKASHSEGASSNTNLAIAYLAAGDNDRAYEILEEIVSLPVQPDQNSIKELKANRWQVPALDEPRFVELRNRMGFQD